MKPFKLKKLLLIIISLIVVGISLSAIYIMGDRHIDTFQAIQHKPSLSNYFSSIKIGIIGDSWVSGKKLDQAIIDELKSSGIKADVVSIGQPGAKSKQIFRNLLSDSSNPYSSNSLLIDDSISFIVVCAGVNDAAGHIGKDFYAQHMQNIVLETNSCSKFPIIVELPEFGIEKPADSYTSELKHDLYRALFDGGKTDIISDYRNALKAKLDTTKLNYKLVPFDPIVKDYSNSLNQYENPWHLTEKGYNRLGTYIGKSIITEYQTLKH